MDDKQQISDRASVLREELKALRTRRGRRGRLIRLYTFTGILMVIGSLVGFGLTKSHWVLIIGGYGMAFLLIPFAGSSRDDDTNILSLEGELDLLETTQILPEQRAEKLFKHHQYELQKYYDQTLRHSKWIFIVGLICIFIGFVVIGATFYFVIASDASGEPRQIQEKILIAVLGTAGSVLANFIAVIYIRMFSEILKSVADFHNRLVGTHNLYFANFIATKVTDAAKRDDNFSEIAKNLSKP
jgi:hypothetical protein